MTPGLTQILIIALIVILLFGASRLSEIGKGLGEGIRSFKKGLDDANEPPPDDSGDALPKQGADAVASPQSPSEPEPAKRTEEA